MVKTFEELRSGADEVTDQDVLTERNLMRRGASLLYARQSKSHGDAATRHFSASTDHLNRPADTMEDQLQNITNALKEMNKGFERLRDQSGSITALCLVSALLVEKGAKR